MQGKDEFALKKNPIFAFLFFGLRLTLKKLQKAKKWSWYGVWVYEKVLAGAECV